MANSEPALFDVDPVALIYRGFTTIRGMRCRECHQVKPYSGCGMTPATIDETGGGGYRYAVCAACFSSPGRRGELARRCGVRGRVVKEVR